MPRRFTTLVRRTRRGSKPAISGGPKGSGVRPVGRVTPADPVTTSEGFEMRSTFSVLAAVVFGGWLASGGRADDKKETTLKGTVLCAKCALKEPGKCVTAIQVKDGEKTVTYYLDDKGTKEEYHETVCGGEKKEGTVVGVVTEKDGKKWVKPSKVEYAKK